MGAAEDLSARLDEVLGELAAVREQLGRLEARLAGVAIAVPAKPQPPKVRPLTARQRAAVNRRVDDMLRRRFGADKA